MTPLAPKPLNRFQYKSSAVAEMGDHLATTVMGRKLGDCALMGELDPHVTQCGLGQGLPSYQVASRSIQPFDHNRRDENWGGLPLRGWSWVRIKHTVAWVEACLRTKWHLDPSSRLATINMGQKVNNTRVISCVFITLLCNNYFPQKNYYS